MGKFKMKNCQIKDISGSIVSDINFMLKAFISKRYMNFMAFLSLKD